MPEKSALREAQPPEGARLLSALLAKEDEDGQIEIIDFQDAIKDALFIDGLHLTEDGMRSFSTVLAVSLGERLSTTETKAQANLD